MMAKKLDANLFVLENDVTAARGAGLLQPSYDQFASTMFVKDQSSSWETFDSNFDDYNESELFELLRTTLSILNPVKSLDTAPQHIPHSRSDVRSSSVVFDGTAIQGSSSPAADMNLGCFANEDYQPDVSEFAELYGADEVEFKRSLACSYKAAPKAKSSPDVPSGSKDLRSKMNSSNSSCDGDSGKYPPNPPNSPARLGAAFENSGSEMEASDSNICAELGVEERSSNRRLPANNQATSLRSPPRPDDIFLKCGSFMVIMILIFVLAIIACLQGLLPEKLSVVFLIMWVLSFAGSCCCYGMGCYCRVEEALEESEESESRTRYGSTGNTIGRSIDS